MQCNKFTMNLKKTQCMLIGTQQKLAKCYKNYINIDNIVLESVEHSKLLGINIGCYLSWSCHINFLTRKTSKEIGVFKTFKKLYVT